MKARLRIGQQVHRFVWGNDGARAWRETTLAWEKCRGLARAVPTQYWRIGPLTYSASPWVAGETLRAAIAAGQAPEMTLAALCAGARALVLHMDCEDPVLHGDISPANLVLRKGGGVEWIDWETAVPWLSERSPPPWFLAKPSYLAPERARTGLASRASEIFALGAIAFEIVAGRRLFSATNAGFRAARNFTDREWGEACRALPPRWLSVIARSVHPFPGFRQGTAGEFARELERALAQR